MLALLDLSVLWASSVPTGAVSSKQAIFALHRKDTKNAASLLAKAEIVRSLGHLV